MKIQNLAVMFIIIILPISILLAEYTKSQVETLSLQSTYDSKLNNATYDALKAYQLNSINSDTSDYANSKMRDIKAAATTFFNSVATNFNMTGYNKDTLQNYVPAMVFTMYDGYYIYSPYENTWDQETINKMEQQKIDYNTTSLSYENGGKLYGLKPYIYYSCRYKVGSNTDIVITYTLDNYITIQGNVEKEVVNKSGYIISGIKPIDDNSINYNNGIIITAESRLKEKVVAENVNGEYEYIKKNGTKYYIDGNSVFIILNNKKVIQNNIEIPAQDSSALNYYKDALEMEKFIESYPDLRDLRVSDAVDENGNSVSEDIYSLGNSKIFDYKNIENESSTFNTHRIDVIKQSIERNLSIAISNYNDYGNSKTKTNFQMPKLKETDWVKIMDNMSIITFLQGLNIGGKVYNGYSVITNTKNQEVVTENSIYIKTANGNIHKPNCSQLLTENLSNAYGIFNLDLERKTAKDVLDDEGRTTLAEAYFFPKYGTLCYDCIVNGNTANTNDWENKVGKIFYTALGRERYGKYRTTLSNIVNTTFDKNNQATYTISYDANGGSGAPTSQTKTEGTNLTLSEKEPTRTGYSFQGWGINSTTTTIAYKPGATYIKDSTIILYAVWKVNTNNVTLETNGGTINSGRVTSYAAGTSVVLPTNVTRTNYIFKGWYENSSFTGNAITSIPATATGDKTYYAKWLTTIIRSSASRSGGVWYDTYDLSQYSQIRVNGTAQMGAGGEFDICNGLGLNAGGTKIGESLCSGTRTLTFDRIVDVSSYSQVSFFCGSSGATVTYSITGIK